MWKRLTTFGKFVAIMFGMLPFYLVATMTDNASAIIILFILCGIAVVAIWAAITQHYKDMRNIERMERDWRQFRNNFDAKTVKKNIKRVFTKEDPYGEEDWSN